MFTYARIGVRIQKRRKYILCYFGVGAHTYTDTNTKSTKITYVFRIRSDYEYENDIFSILFLVDFVFVSVYV